jgi:glycosyltransferase involved in cell wall biosynthesis
VRAIESALAQTHREVQVAVYDNASGDETEHVVRTIAARDPRLSYFRQPSNLGLLGNLAVALQQLSTPYFSILSDDDLLLPGFYQAALRELETHPRAGYAATQVLHADEAGRGLRLPAWQPGLYSPPGGLLSLVEQGPPIWTGILFRTSVIEEVGGLDPETGMVVDVDFQFRIAARRPFAVSAVPGAVFFHRSGSISGDARLVGTWPGWRRLMENLQRDQAVPTPLKVAAEPLLLRQLAIRLYGIAVRGGRQGNAEDAFKAIDVLESYGLWGRARRARILLFLYRLLPGFRALHARLAALKRYGSQAIPEVASNPRSAVTATGLTGTGEGVAEAPGEVAPDAAGEGSGEGT